MALWFQDSHYKGLLSQRRSELEELAVLLVASEGNAVTTSVHAVTCGTGSGVDRGLIPCKGKEGHFERSSDFTGLAR